MAACAESMLELHKATILYLARPRGEFRYGRCALLAHEVTADEDRPIIPRRMGAMLVKTAVEENVGASKVDSQQLGSGQSIAVRDMIDRQRTGKPWI